MLNTFLKVSNYAKKIKDRKDKKKSIKKFLIVSLFLELDLI